MTFVSRTYGFHLNTQLYRLFTFTALTSLGCMSVPGYQDGRTIGQGNGEIQTSLNYHKGPSLDFFNKSKSINDIPHIDYASIQVLGKYGVTERVDISFRSSSTLDFSTGVKYQILGDKISAFALGVGAEIGRLSINNNYSAVHLQLPLFTSYHPNKNMTLYFAPRYIKQFKSEIEKEGYNYFGSSVGFLYGNKNKIGLDIGFYKVSVKDLGYISIINIGLGGKFLMSNNKIISKKSK